MSAERVDLAAEVVQSLRTDVGVTGHAHPSASSVSLDETGHQYVERFLANVVFDVELCGLALHSNASPSDMHCPRLRRSESKQQAIDHLDVVSCWKGISNAQALELTLWERLFQTCLASQVENDLRRRTIVQLSKVRDGVEDNGLLPSLLQSLPSEESRLIEVNLPDLIRDIIGAFYSDHSSQTAGRNFRWSLGSSDLPGFIYNYIATQDCFMRSSERLYLSAEVTIDYSTVPVVTVIARLRWQPPDVRFRPTPSQLGLRGQYIIAPYREPDSSSYNRFPENVEYTVMRSTSMIQWDIFGEVFRAQAPDSPTTSETLVQASIVTQFPDNVRFERVSRYIVRVEVVNTLQVDEMQDKYRPQTKDISTPHMPPYTGMSCLETGPLRKIRQHRDLQAGLSEASRKHRPDTPKKRKALLRTTSYDGVSTAELVHDESGTCLKRPKLELLRDTDVHAALVDLQNDQTAVEECKAMLEALETFRRHVESRTASTERLPSEVALRLHVAVAPALHLVYAAIKEELSTLKDLKGDDCHTPVKGKGIPVIPVGQMPTSPETPMEPDSRYCSASESASHTSDFDITKPIVGTSSARPLHSAELSQDEIQKNYREFEEIAKRRKSDPTTASSCDVGDMDFERIFLEDSEVEGVSGVSGLSDGIDGLMVGEV
ncbi:hypothetical protein G6011_03505 [Alternaria panax]|uniref:Uncharacterized protein n=1 Tax=Alternaria panax TaxID=48097 RepID=A0AAD4IF68_9PLEO|nr:hypothetical protein G6011_03505 [Alternaria panax]